MSGGRLAVLVLLSACGRIGFDATTGIGTDDDDASSGATDALDGDGPGVASDVLVAPNVCGSTVLLSDDFEDGTIAASWTVLSGTNLSASETAGELRLTFGTNVPSNQEAGYQQTSPMDYTGTCVTADVLQIPASTATGRLEVRLDMGTSAYVFFEVLQGSLHGFVNDGTGSQHPLWITWNIGTARFLRIREASGTWYFEISPDDVTYTLGGMSVLPVPGTTAAKLKLHVTTSASVSNGGQVRFGSVRVVTQP